MAKITPFDYHSDKDKHGDYQFLPLKELVSEIEFAYSDEDHILKNIRRSRILFYAKDCIRTLNKQVFNDILAMEITVPESLSIVMPHNFVDWVRISVVVEDTSTESYRLKPLNINREINISDGYLQDNDAEILFDSNGGILMADSKNAYAKPYKKYEFTTTSGQKGLDTSKLSTYGEFTIDKRRGKILFSSDLSDQEIVLEYLSDGLSFDTYGDEKIRVHKTLAALVKNWVYYSLIESRKNVSANKIEMARRKYKTSLHESKIEQSDFDFIEIERVMRSSSKTI